MAETTINKSNQEPVEGQFNTLNTRGTLIGTNEFFLLNKDAIEKLVQLGILKTSFNTCRNTNVGKSNYAEHLIQPWSIWIDYNLNPWDADIVKRVLRTKEESGMSEKDARIMDYQKIKHICDERIRQLELESNITYTSISDIIIPQDTSINTIGTYSFKPEDIVT